MPPDDQRKRKLDLGEDLDLTGGEDEQERQRQRKRASIPGRVEKSPLVRKVIVGRQLPGRSPRHRGEDEEPADGPPEVAPPTGPAEEPAPPAVEEPRARDEAPAGGNLRKVVAPVPGAKRSEDDSGPTESPGGKPSDGSDASHQPRRRRRSGVDAEAEWTGSRGTLWWVLAGLGGMIVIGVLLFRDFQRSGTKEPISEPYRPPESAGIEGTPMEGFVQQSTALLPIVGDLITKVATRKEGEGAELFREGEETLARMDGWHQRVPELAKFNLEARYDLHAAATQGTGYLTLDGWREDYTSALIYILELDGRHVVDWEATVGYSELLPEEVTDLPGDETYLMRCVVSRSLYYTSQYPEDEFLCYALHHRDPAVYTWAYANRRSSEASALEGHMSFNLKPPVGGRATLRVRKAQAGARPNQVEVVEFLHAGWVKPLPGKGEEAGSGLENDAVE